LEGDFLKQVLFFILSTLLIHVSAEASEITRFKADWCSANQILVSDIRTVCYGEAQLRDVGSTRAVAFKRRNGVRELFIESDFTTVDMFNLDVKILGPVASSQPRSRFAPKYIGRMQLTVDNDGEVSSVQGMLQTGERFFSVRQ
jgi:hypothetical protein